MRTFFPEKEARNENKSYPKGFLIEHSIIKEVPFTLEDPCDGEALPIKNTNVSHLPFKKQLLFEDHSTSPKEIILSSKGSITPKTKLPLTYAIPSPSSKYSTYSSNNVPYE